MRRDYAITLLMTIDRVSILLLIGMSSGTRGSEKDACGQSRS